MSEVDTLPINIGLKQAGIAQNTGVSGSCGRSLVAQRIVELCCKVDRSIDPTSSWRVGCTGNGPFIDPAKSKHFAIKSNDGETIKMNFYFSLLTYTTEILMNLFTSVNYIIIEWRLNCPIFLNKFFFK